MMVVHVADPAREIAEPHEGEDRHQGVEQDVDHDREAPSLSSASTKTPKGAPLGRIGAIQFEAPAASLLSSEVSGSGSDHDGCRAAGLLDLCHRISGTALPKS